MTLSDEQLEKRRKTYQHVIATIVVAMERLPKIARMLKLDEGVAAAIVTETYALLGIENAQEWREENERQWHCKGCNGYPDDYMVTHETWAEAQGGKGLLCLRCLERRLQRPLTRADFPNVHIEHYRYPPEIRLTPVGRAQHSNDVFWLAYRMGQRDAALTAEPPGESHERE